MTSRKALLLIKRYCVYYDEFEAISVIEKDLETLEILKDSITDKEAHTIIMKDEITEKMKGEEFMILHYTIKGTEKVKKVKRWLKYDK